jgi:hypothetical protein
VTEDEVMRANEALGTLVNRVIAERDSALASIARVKQIHRRSLFPATSGEWRGQHYCPACTYTDDGWTAYAIWPCATAVAVGETGGEAT